MAELPPTRHYVAPHDVAASFIVALQAEGWVVTEELLATLMAQSALETGHWGWMYAFNFGNVKATDKWIADGGDYTYYDTPPPHSKAPVSENLTREQMAYNLKLSAKRDNGEPDMAVVGRTDDGRYICLFWPRHVQCRFRAFKTLDEGAAAYVSKLSGRYRASLEYATVGDVRGYVYSLHAGGYFTADVSRYTSVVQTLFRKYEPIARESLQARAGWWSQLARLWW